MLTIVSVESPSPMELTTFEHVSLERKWWRLGTIRNAYNHEKEKYTSSQNWPQEAMTSERECAQ